MNIKAEHSKSSKVRYNVHDHDDIYHSWFSVNQLSYLEQGYPIICEIGSGYGGLASKIKRECKKFKIIRLIISFVEPYKNVNAAKTSNNGAYPPDLSLMVKARKDGANYVRSLLLGYTDPPKDFDVGEGYYNKYMAGNVIAMPQPLYGEDIEFSDGTIATLEQEVNDLVSFLTWTSMPDLENRRAAGVKVIFFLLIMTFLFYISYRKIWSELKS